MPRPFAPAVSARAATRRMVLEQIWANESIARAEIARRTGLSRTTVSEIVNEMISMGVLEDVGAGQSSGGRPPINVRPVDDARVFVGVELGASHIEVVIMNLVGSILASRGELLRVTHQVEASVAAVVRLVDEALSDAGVDRGAALGVGLGVSSPLDGSDLRHVSAMTMPAWGGVDMISQFEDRLGMPVRMDNDANLGALAEQWWGDGRDSDHFTYVKLDVGVGAGHILDGHRYTGARGGAGEIGHTNTGSDRRCRCGRVGCMETDVGSEAVTADYIELSGAPLDTTIEQVADAAAAGDRDAIAAVSRAGAVLGRCLASVVSLLNPDKIILSGPLTRAGSAFLDAVEHEARARSLPKSADETTVVVSSFKDLTVALGAATAALDATFGSGAAAWRVSSDARRQAVPV